jgi:hypothetical protein
MSNARNLAKLKPSSTGLIGVEDLESSLDLTGKTVTLPTGVGGKVLQVVQTVKTDTFSTSSGNSWVPITGLSASITPTSASNKVLIMCSLGAVMLANNGGIRLQRNSTSIYTGNADGSRLQVAIGDLYNGGDLNGIAYAFSFVDSPSSTSSVTYSLELRFWSSGTSYINRGAQNEDAAYRTRAASSIILMEIAA